MGTVILLRHGESTWNAEGLFTGWVDVPLSPTGTKEAAAAGQLLADAGARPDVLYTSLLTRSIQTANLATTVGRAEQGDTITYTWDLDNNGTFETPGQSVSFSAPDGPATPTVTVRATDPSGSTATASTTVTVQNVAPTATFNAPASSFAGFPFTLSLTSPHDPSAADTAAGFQYAFDCGTHYGAFGSASSVSCPTDDTGTRTVHATIRDKDGGTAEFTATVQVNVTFTSLCNLTRQYSSKVKLADRLCGLLANAEADATSGAPPPKPKNDQPPPWEPQPAPAT